MLMAASGWDKRSGWEEKRLVISGRGMRGGHHAWKCVLCIDGTHSIRKHARSRPYDFFLVRGSCPEEQIACGRNVGWMREEARAMEWKDSRRRRRQQRHARLSIVILYILQHRNSSRAFFISIAGLRGGMACCLSAASAIRLGHPVRHTVCGI